ncbi:MAG: 50S ribosomal protein L17 [bacterium]
MRHKIDGRQLGRNTGARKALFCNLVTSLFEHDKIVTTHAKAKEARRVAEKLITKAKKNSVHARRQIARIVKKKDVVKRLFDDIVSRLKDSNNGGYTRIVKIGYRKGDNAPLVLLEIIDPSDKPQKN